MSIEIDKSEDLDYKFHGVRSNDGTFTWTSMFMQNLKKVSLKRKALVMRFDIKTTFRGICP